MKKINIEEEVSISADLWKNIKNKTDEIKSNIKVKDIDGTFIKIRRQGSVATRTIINPLISKGKNELDLDIAIVIEEESISTGRKTFLSIEEEMKRIFPNNTFKRKSKALSTEFEIYNNGEKYILGVDIVFLLQNKKQELMVWNIEENSHEISDPFSLIDLFNDKAKIDNEIRLTNKTIKALRDKMDCKGLKSIFIINSSIKSDKNDLHSVVSQMIADTETLERNGYVLSASNPKDKIIKSSDFSYERTIKFLRSILGLDSEEISEILNVNGNTGIAKNTALKAAPIIGKVHGIKQ